MSVSRPAVYTIPPHRAFADALAAGLIARYGADKTGLARGLILVPNNRAARAISDAFVRRSEGGLLLPRLVPVGDPELDERIGGALDPLEEGEAIPPAIEPVERTPHQFGEYVKSELAKWGKIIQVSGARIQ